jgi:hypothetical protein
MKALIFSRLVDAHDGTLALPVLAFYLGLGFFFLVPLLGSGLMAAALIAQGYKRHVNSKYDSRLEALKSMSEAIKGLQERLDKVEPKLSRVANKVNMSID